MGRYLYKYLSFKTSLKRFVVLAKLSMHSQMIQKKKNTTLEEHYTIRVLQMHSGSHHLDDFLSPVTYLS